MIRLSRSTRNQLASRAEPNLSANSVLTLGTSLRVPRHVLGFRLAHIVIFKHPLNAGCFYYGMTIRSCLVRSNVGLSPAEALYAYGISRPSVHDPQEHEILASTLEFHAQR